MTTGSAAAPDEPEQPSAWSSWVGDRCSAIDDAGRWRSVRSFDAQGPTGQLRVDAAPAREVVSYASNDYLGLTQHPAVKAAAIEAVERWGTGSGAARLVVGSRPVHHDLDRELAEWRGTEAALLFPTGFAANLSALTTFGPAGVRILSDELNHASIIDGSRMARAEVEVYRHGDADHLADRLDRARADGVARTMIVTDTVFSMDGDLAPLDAIIDLARRHGSLLVIDEAHATLGPSLDGTVSGGPALDGVDVLRVGTLSKTLGSLGGFIAGPRAFIDLMINAARPFIFTTASSPADTAAGLAALRIVRSAEGDELRRRLRGHVERLAPGHPSPVIPVVVGDERDAVALSASLLDQGLLVPAIRPPTVPVGTSRLRVALSAAHTTEQIEVLAQALALAWPGRIAVGPGRPVSTPRRLVVVLGTGTEVGKTWVASRVLERLRADGVRVAARKPVQSFAPGDATTDAAELAAATDDTPTEVCPSARWYEIAMAPPMAAEALGRPPFTLTDLVDELVWPDDVEVGVVETAGGLCSPMASDDGDGIALAAALMPDVVVLVADAGLGTINSIRLAVAALEPVVESRDALELLVVLNRFDPTDGLHRRNLAWLTEHDGLTPLTSVDAVADALRGG